MQPLMEIISATWKLNKLLPVGGCIGWGWGVVQNVIVFIFLSYNYDVVVASSV